MAQEFKVLLAQKEMLVSLVILDLMVLRVFLEVQAYLVLKAQKVMQVILFLSLE